MYAFQEWAENFSRWTAPRFGGAAAQRNETERVLKEHASEKRYRRDSQRTGTWARDETDEISRLKPGRAIALFHGRCLQCETISKSARIPDDNACSEPCLRARTFHFPGYGIVAGENFSMLTLLADRQRLLAAVANQIEGFFSRIADLALFHLDAGQCFRVICLYQQCHLA